MHLMDCEIQLMTQLSFGLGSSLWVGAHLPPTIPSKPARRVTAFHVRVCILVLSFNKWPYCVCGLHKCFVFAAEQVNNI